jgi:hypothetical protein
MIRKHAYHTLEDVQLRKEELQAEIEKQNEEIGALWSGLFAPRRANTKGELITNIISNSITAFDAFMLVRKLMTQYGSLFGKKKRR